MATMNMNINKIFIACVLAIIPTFGISQNIIHPYLEFGFNFSQLPSKNLVVTWQISDSTETNTYPIIRPVIGISYQLGLMKNFHLQYGLNYQISGTKTFSYSHWTDPHIYPSSFFKNWQTIKFHKVTLPIVLSFEFNYKNNRPMIYVGTKPNIIISAKLYEKSFHSQWTDPIETATNLFSEKADYQPPKRIINQLSFGFMIPIGNNLKVNLCYNMGHNYYTKTYWIQGNHSRVPSYVKTSLKSSDFILSLQFKFTKSEKNKSSP